MKFSLIICTYMRPNAIEQLLDSVAKQTLYPDEIIIVDGSNNEETKVLIDRKNYKHAQYFLVDKKHRGLTKQRNFGIEKVSTTSEIVCFLDDDTILDSFYFKELLETYQTYPEAVGVGGYITNEVSWIKKTLHNINYFSLDGYSRATGSRNVLRTKLKLQPNTRPGWMPKYSHGYPTSFLPPSGKLYPVEFFMGCAMSFSTKILLDVKFSEYFEGYGLYEDMDFCLRVSERGKLFVNTKSKLEHHHDASGRPNMYTYGKMVVRNGWYVWRLKFSRPNAKNRFKWSIIVLLHMFLRFLNVFNSTNRKAALTETLGRKIGWLSLIFNKPKIQR